MYRFVLEVKYGTGKAYWPTNEPDIMKAIQEFQMEYSREIPDTKMYGLPEILSASIHPLMYRKDSND